MAYKYPKKCGAPVLIAMTILAYGCSHDDAARQSFFAEKLACPPPSVAEFDPWGQQGSEHVCKIKHGPFVAFESDHVKLRGQYDNGVEVGIWRWYDAAGKVEKEVDYSRKQ